LTNFGSVLALILIILKADGRGKFKPQHAQSVENQKVILNQAPEHKDAT